MVYINYSTYSTGHSIYTCHSLHILVNEMSLALFFSTELKLIIVVSGCTRYWVLFFSVVARNKCV